MVFMHWRKRMIIHLLVEQVIVYQILVGLILFSSACTATSKDPLKPKAPISNGQSKSEEFQCSGLSDLDHFAQKCLERACKQSGGTFEISPSSCQCPQGQYFTGWGYPSCVSYSKNRECWSSADDGKIQCSVFDLRSGNSLNTGTVIVQPLTSSTPDEALALVSESDEIKWSPPVNFQRTLLTLLVGPGQLSDKQLRQILEPVNIVPYQAYIDEFNPVTKFIYLDSKDDLIGLLKNSQPERATFLVPPEIDSQMRRGVDDFLSRIGSEPFQLKSFISERGCLDSCLLEQAINLAKGFHGVYRLQYIGGVIANRWALLFQETMEAPVAAFIWTSNQIPSLQIYFHEDNQREKLIRTARAYNRSGKVVGNLSQVLFNFEELTSIKEKLKQRERHFKSNILFCEGAFDPKLYIDGPFAGSLKLGPNESNSVETGSFLGWLSGGDASHFYNELISINEFGFRTIANQSFVSHAKDVVTLALTDSNQEGAAFGFIPARMSTCFDRDEFQVLTKNLPPDVKIINVSASSYISESVCKSKGVFPQAQMDKPFLWIVAAGNSGFSPDEAKKKLCPQSFAGQENMIIVAGLGNGKWLHERSNRGIAYADLAANGNLDSEFGWGTSYATPRVARVAAKIAEMYPELSTKFVRLSILLGTDYVPGLEVRSSGVLNEEKSMAMAKELSVPSNDPLEARVSRALTKVFCSFNYKCDLQKTKMKLFKARFI